MNAGFYPKKYNLHTVLQSNAHSHTHDWINHVWRLYSNLISIFLNLVVFLFWHSSIFNRWRQCDKFYRTLWTNDKVYKWLFKAIHDLIQEMNSNTMNMNSRKLALISTFVSITLYNSTYIPATGKLIRIAY